MRELFNKYYSRAIRALFYPLLNEVRSMTEEAKTEIKQALDSSIDYLNTKIVDMKERVLSKISALEDKLASGGNSIDISAELNALKEAADSVGTFEVSEPATSDTLPGTTTEPLNEGAGIVS